MFTGLYLPPGIVELQATPGLWQGPCEAERSQTIALESGVRRKTPAPFGRGKDCKVLPILTVDQGAHAIIMGGSAQSSSVIGTPLATGGTLIIPVTKHKLEALVIRWTDKE